MPRKLTPKQEMFVTEFLIDLNATKAARRAGYSDKTANRIASENLSKPVIQQAIARAMEKRIERVEIDQDYVLNQAVKLHKRCMQEIKPIIASGMHTGDENGNLIFKFDSAGAARALELIGKHVSVQAWKERKEVDVVTRTLSDIIKEIDGKSKGLPNLQPKREE